MSMTGDIFHLNRRLRHLLRGMAVGGTLLVQPAAWAQLRIEVISAYNLVVDSNVESPSTYAPRAAYLGATYHNDGTNALTDVWAYIGDYAAGTPGLYPSRAHPPLNGPLPGDEFALTHEGGALGAADATRFSWAECSRPLVELLRGDIAASPGGRLPA